MKHNVFEKLGAKLDKYKFLGYPKQTTEYYFYHHVEQKIFSQNMLYF
jgi:nucleoside diphosphate kinase